MCIIKYLERSIRLVEKEHEDLNNKITDFLGLKPIHLIDIKKYLSINTEERLTRARIMESELMELTEDIDKLNNLIWAEQHKIQRSTKIEIT